jgi:hypothetical protein
MAMVGPCKHARIQCAMIIRGPAAVNGPGVSLQTKEYGIACYSSVKLRAPRHPAGRIAVRMEKRLVSGRRRSASYAHRMPLAGLSLVQTKVVCNEDSIRCCQCSFENTYERFQSSPEAWASGSSPPHSQRQCRRSSLCISVLYSNSAVTAGTNVRLLLYPITDLDSRPQAVHVWG